MLNPKGKILLELKKRVQMIPVADAAHDLSHIHRVIQLTQRLYSQEQELDKKITNKDDLLDCEAAALLHDCVPIAKDSPLRKESSRLASEKAREWLTELNWNTPENEKSVETIAQAILDHSYSASIATGRKPISLLGKCLQDADRLEALGVIGIYRTLATGVAMKAEFFDPIDPWAENRVLDDKKFSIDHFFTKLLKLPETFCTRSARDEALKRAEYMRGFLAQLKHELN